METEVIVPLDYHIYFLKTKSCMCCHQPLRHEMHSYNHFRKYHLPGRKIEVDKPHYFVWFERQWVEVNMETYLAAGYEKRSRALLKPKNTEEGN